MRAWIATLAGLAGFASGCSSSSPSERSAQTAKAAASQPAASQPAASQDSRNAVDSKKAMDSKKPSPDPAPDAANIVTAEVLKMNGPEFGRPAAKFRTGSVTLAEAPKSTKTPTGFEVRFASHATITTPTVYEHKVLVSGGFQGKQLFAYEAGTGKPLWGADLHDDGPTHTAYEDGRGMADKESYKDRAN